MNDSAQGSWSAVAGVALLTTAIGSIFFVSGPLESRRPDRDATHALSSQAETVPARLWQDPLGVIQADWNAIVSHVSASETLPAQIALPDALKDLWPHALKELPEPQLWLFAMVSGSPYADDVEHRRRDRYAIVTALTKKDFDPEQPARIGYVVGPSFAGCPNEVDVWAAPAEVAAKCTMLLGFERYNYNDAKQKTLQKATKQKPTFKSAVVFWLNGDDFKEYPLQRVAGLVTAIRPSSVQFTPVLLGPPTSEMLKAMLVDDDRQQRSLAEAASFVAQAETYKSTRQLLQAGYPGDPNPDSILPDRIKSGVAAINILSTRSTVPLDLLFGDRIEPASGAVLGENDVAEALLVPTFRSVVLRDDVVLLKILDELADRGACRVDHDDRDDHGGHEVGLAVVAERDSVYGRLFGHIVERRRYSGDLACNFDVREYGYLKGDDGESSRREPADQTASPDSGSGVFHPLLPSVDGAEPAHGDAQLDYIRRIAEQIKNDTRKHPGDGVKSDHTRKRFGDGAVVVGVLGADIYDKQLVLQALRESLPSATYFTTDLDARLHDPGAKRTTRNLIVGSSHGLTVDKHPGAVFRDSYQTATYLATDMALAATLRGKESDDFSPCDGHKDPPGCNLEPRLFEIGLNKTVDLSPSHPSPWGWSQLQAALLLLSPLLGLTLVALTLARRMRASSPLLARRAYVNTSALAAATAIALLILIHYAAQPGGEPTDYLEGVSSIPALVLEATTAAFAFSIILIVCARVGDADHKLFDRVDRPEQPPSVSSGVSWKHALKWTRKPPDGSWALVSLLKEHRDEGEKSLETVLTDYIKNQPLVRRVSWIVPRFAVAATAVLLVVFVDDHGPLLTRGMHTLATTFHLAMLLSVVLCICVWSYYINLDRSLIRQLVRNPLPDLSARVKATDPAMLEDFSRRRDYVIDLVVERTRLVGSSIVLPFLLFPTMMLSHSTVFEGWVWNTPHLALLAAIATYILIQALGYQREATEARRRVIEELQRHRRDAGNRSERRIAKEVIANTRSIRQGAFSPWTRHPILQSLALPLGGLALVALLNFLF